MKSVEVNITNINKNLEDNTNKTDGIAELIKE
jgi:hypothetical protein